MSANSSFDFSIATDAIRVPVGTTAQRPNPKTGDIRYNSTLDTYEGAYANNQFVPLGSASGAVISPRTFAFYNS